MKRAGHPLLDVRRAELGLVAVACLFFFCLLAFNYVVRPVRDEMGVSGGPEKLPWLYSGSLAATLVFSPLFAWLVSRMPRQHFLAITYRFFALVLIGFYFALHGQTDIRGSITSQVFFVWFSAFNLLLISTFWGFLGDVFQNAQAKRVYGLIGAGGTLGAIAGSGATSWLMSREDHPDPVTLLLAAAVLLEICVHCMRWMARRAPPPAARSAIPDVERPDTWTGVRLIAQKPYLRVLCLYMLLQTICATFLYYEQGEILYAKVPERAARTVFLADISFWVNSISLGFQLLFTGRALQRFGVLLCLMPLPLVAIGGFIGLASTGSLLAVQTAMILSRSCEYATAKPARETLYTVVSRSEKYQSKSFIDTFVYRGGDFIGGWAFTGLHAAAGLSLAAVAWLAVPLAAIWAAAAYRLGRQQEALAASVAALESPTTRG